MTLRTGGVPETIPAGMEGREPIVASDRARTMTAATANISCGSLID